MTICSDPYRTNAKPPEEKPKRDYSAWWRLSHILFFPLLALFPVVFVLFIASLPLLLPIKYIFQLKTIPDPYGLTLDYVRIWFSNGIKPGTRTKDFWNCQYRHGYWFKSYDEWNKREKLRAKQYKNYIPKTYYPY